MIALSAQVDEIIRWTLAHHGDKGPWDRWAKRFHMRIDRTLRTIVEMRETYPDIDDPYSAEALADDVRRAADHCAGTLACHLMGYQSEDWVVDCIYNFNTDYRPDRV